MPIDSVKQAAETNEVTAQFYLGCSFSDGLGIEKNPAEAFKWMKLAAQQGMARAQRNLGEMLDNGTGVEKNSAEAFGWYQKAAQQGDAWAQVDIGYDYQSGIGTEKNVNEAFGWYQKSAAQGNTQAQVKLGLMYENGNGVSQDYAQAANFYRLAAEQGNADGQNNLGWLYKNGWGVPLNYIEAAKWFQKAVESGELMGAENLAWMYIYGNGVERNNEMAERWILKTFDTNSVEGQYKMGDFITHEFDSNGHEIDANFFRAAEWFRLAAEKGDAKAQFQLAELYNYGKLGNDQRSNCIPWYLKSAANGDAEAQAEIGKLHEFYPNSDLLKSVNPIDSLKQAAEQGDLSAEFDLAHRYHIGDGVPKDPAEAFKWMDKAAQHDISPVTLTIDAHYYLGVMYETGEGVTKNLTNAFQLYQEAAVGGNKPEPFVRLGQMYENGEGVPQDDRLAAENYYQALQFGFFPTSDDTARCTAIENLLGLYVQRRGFPDDTNLVNQQLTEIKRNHPVTTAKAQFLLGQIYFQGKIVPQNLVEAAAWLRLSSNQSLDEARKELEQVESGMSSEQKEAAKSRFDDLDKSIGGAKRSYQQLENYRRSHSW